jgi:hypothetical protein
VPITCILSCSRRIICDSLCQNMKLSVLCTALLAGLSTALPTSLAKRAAVTDPCNIGYCTQNGG